MRTGKFVEDNMVACSHTANEAAAQALYGLVVSRARDSTFYTRFGVADTVDGRFDMIVLHTFLLLRRLGLEKGTTSLAQALFDVMFSDMDCNLREMGVSDLRVGRQVKNMVKAFYGRVVVYDTALSSSENHLLAEAIRRNVYRNVVFQHEHVNGMVLYVRKVATKLATLSIDTLKRGRVSFGALPDGM